MARRPQLVRLEAEWDTAKRRLDEHWQGHISEHLADRQWVADVRGLEEVLERAGDAILALAKAANPSLTVRVTRGTIPG
jgi:hypothetical protein